MIELAVTTEHRQIMARIDLPVDTAKFVLNNRHREFTDDQFTRFIAAHWFSENRLVLVDGKVTKKELVHTDGETSTVRIDEVAGQNLLHLRPQLPGGNLLPQMDISAILEIIASSFGIPLTCDCKEQARSLYSGPSDGLQPWASYVPGRTYSMCGAFDVKAKYAELVYALDVEKYVEWFTAK
jgi:hypothetical protein